MAPASCSKQDNNVPHGLDFNCRFATNTDGGKTKMKNRKSKDRRRLTFLNSFFPLLTREGPVLQDRRRKPDRRLNSIKAVFLDRIH
jgi:hypothetical protein